jgi:hypothetical protein
MEQLQSANPLEIELLAQSKRVSDCLYLEYVFHEKYARYRVHGEWYALPKQSIQELIASVEKKKKKKKNAP